jgi:hypothetical protein
MRQLHVMIPDALDNEFRKLVGEKYGSRKGALGKAVVEALILWISKNKSKGVHLKE